jgi:glutathione reductase (NADPH)
MPSFDFDLVVVGGGSGGVRAARVAAELGARVALIEAGQLGGTCVNAGCVPKKLLAYAAQFAREFADSGGYGWEAPVPAFDWPALIAQKDHEITRLNGLYQRTLERAGVTIFAGRARFEDAHSLEFGGQRLRARFVLIATGGAPRHPRCEGASLTITSDEAFHLPSLPQRVTLIGGGYVGLEFACIFHWLGARVQLVHHGAHLLSTFDQDIGEHVTQALRKHGIDVRCGVEVLRVARSSDGLAVALSDGDELASDLVLSAIGRTPRTAGLGLAEIGVQTNRHGAVQVDAYCRSSLEHVFAVGDCIGRFALTPVAIAEGQAVAHTLFGKAAAHVDYENVPTAVFSSPPVASVGLSEHIARLRHPELDIYRSRFTPLKNTLSGRDEQTLVKLVVDRLSQRVLGCHMVGQDAPEVIQGFALALRLGATKADFDATIGVHPTAAEEFVTLRHAVG